MVKMAETAILTIVAPALWEKTATTAFSFEVTR
jgi:hypothetical protein